jgi:GT2 family glycosyltransferase
LDQVNEQTTELSVVIVSYRVKNFLRLCLEASLISAHRMRGQIIVVDNNSGDGSAEMVEKHYPEVILISNRANIGFSAACNQGIRVSQGRYILILNPDTVVPADAFEKFTRFMDDHPDAGASGARLTDREGKFLPESKRGIPMPLTAFFRFSHIYRLAPNSPVINRYYMGHIGEHSTSAVEALTGAFLFLRREAVFDAGLFDERYFMYGEDIDLCFQIGRAGYRIYYFPEVTVTHFKGCSGAMNSYRGLGHFFRSMHIFIEKNLQNHIFPLRSLLHVAVFLTAIATFIVRTPSIVIRRFVQ